MGERPKAIEILKHISDLLLLVMALKDAYNDISKRHNRGDKVDRRVKQLRANLSAVLEADRFAAADPVRFERGHKEPPLQLSLFDDKSKGKG